MNEFWCNDCQTFFTTEKLKCKECPTCGNNDIQEISVCCGDFINEMRICPKCKEHC